LIGTYPNRTRGAVIVAICAVFASSFLFAQVNQLPADSRTAAATLPRFEVATIKPPNPRGGIVGLLTYPGGRIFAGESTLDMLVMEAFDVQQFQVTGGPGWADTERFNIEAEPSAGSAAAQFRTAKINLSPTPEIRKMLLALLIDRFQLRYHTEKKSGPVFLLERGNGTLKLVAPKDPNEFPWFGGIEGGAVYRPTGVAAQNISMPVLASRLSRYLERPVIDQTGLLGSFDFKYETGDVDPSTPYNRNDVISSILTGIHGIGLQLKSAKGPVETIVIDSAAQPSPN
jgi:uncharacterized protein (TIGR03435 family)